MREILLSNFHRFSLVCGSEEGISDSRFGCMRLSRGFTLDNFFLDTFTVVVFRLRSNSFGVECNQSNGSGPLRYGYRL
jgi:hypothetical protein